MYTHRHDVEDQQPMHEPRDSDAVHLITTRPDAPAVDDGAADATTAAPGARVSGQCPGCGTAADPTWAFCEWCGHDLAATTPNATLATTLEKAEPESGGIIETAGGRHRRWPIRRVLLASVAALVGIGLVTAGVLVHLGTRSDLHKTRQRLVSTQHRLNDTTSKLRTSEASLARTQTELGSEIKKRQSIQKELAGVRGSLDDANSKVNLQASRIETLKSCLNGVSSALHYLSYSDYSATVAALDAVEVSCNKAYKMF